VPHSVACAGCCSRTAACLAVQLSLHGKGGTACCCRVLKWTSAELVLLLLASRRPPSHPSPSLIPCPWQYCSVHLQKLACRPRAAAPAMQWPICASCSCTTSECWGGSLFPLDLQACSCTWPCSTSVVQGLFPALLLHASARPGWLLPGCSMSSRLGHATCVLHAVACEGPAVDCQAICHRLCTRWTGGREARA